LSRQPAREPAEPAALAEEAQRRIVDYYRLGSIPPVRSFVRSSTEAERERLWVRQTGAELEVALELPPRALSLPAAALDARVPGELDALCQVVEGVSHFVLLADRALVELPTTELEMELQAELDKYLLLALAPARPLARGERRALHARLFRHVRFRHGPATARGARYRYAHRLAWRLTRQLERRYLRHGRHADLRVELRRLYRQGQQGKIAAALSA
jgi:hypothetical protein